MLDYALEYEMVDKNYARTFSLSDDVYKEQEEQRRGHIPFTDEEMTKLWNNQNIIKWIDVILFQCYSGWRPQELGLLEVEKVDLDKNIIIGGMKTDSGKDRIVPIHECVRPFVEKWMQEAAEIGSKYLINCADGVTHRNSIKLTYDKYAQRFKKVIKDLDLNPLHRAHDPRKHFVTMAKKYKLDEYAIKYIVGHKISDITEKIYTERDPEWLKKEMQKIKRDVISDVGMQV